MSCGESSINLQCFHARTAPLVSAIFFAAPVPMHHLRFGNLAANSHASGRIAKSQSGRLTYDSLLADQQCQSTLGCPVIPPPKNQCAEK